jgi:IS5 family transposase
VKVSIATTLKEGLVVGCRFMPGNPYDTYTLDETLEQCGTDQKSATAIVDKGYRGARIDGVRIVMPGQKRGITRTLKAMIKRRSAIEPTIGHMKMDGRLGRNWLKGALGDALHAMMCGAGNKLRLILAALRRYCAHTGQSMQAVIAQLGGLLLSCRWLRPVERIIQGRLITF